MNRLQGKLFMSDTVSIYPKVNDLLKSSKDK